MGFQEEGFITASYATGGANGGAGQNDLTGGLVGFQEEGYITASYAHGTADGGVGADYAGKLIGHRTNDGIFLNASYGFGMASNGSGGIDTSTLPNGITTEAALTATNLTGCVGIANEKAYTVRTICTSVTKLQCTWSTNTCSGNPYGVDCAVFTEQTACEAKTKTIGTWNGDVWNSADSDTAGAWDFGSNMQSPALRYADYDGAGTDYDCSMFPANKCNTLIPGQR